MGREGQGPGEFQGPDALRWGPDGRLWVVDQRNARVSVFDTAGIHLLGYVRPVTSHFMPLPGETMEDGTIVDLTIVSTDDALTSRLLSWDTSGAVLDTLPLPSLEEAEAAGRVQHRLKVLTHPALLIVDEIGYLPVTRTGATLFFQLVNRRYEGASTVLTSNKSFEEWGEVFGDEVMAAALIDRLLHHCHIVNIRGNSFRMRQHTELWQALHGEPDPL